MQTLLYKRIPTKRGECMIELLALGKEELIKPIEKNLLRKKEEVTTCFIKNIKTLTKLQAKSLLTEDILLSTLK